MKISKKNKIVPLDREIRHPDMRRAPSRLSREVYVMAYKKRRRGKKK